MSENSRSKEIGRSRRRGSFARHRSRAHAQRRRGGTVLILFVLVLFAMFAIAGLAIDLGLVRVTQKQMQSAADVAALEGVRELGENGGNDGDRRSFVRDLVGLHYGAALGNDEQNFGFGPIIDVLPNQNGASGGDLDANGLLAIDTAKAKQFYRPTLATNDGNESRGDMVSGTFTVSKFLDVTNAPNPDQPFFYEQSTGGSNTKGSIQIQRQPSRPGISRSYSQDR
ncbi:MAG: TadE/TadG family type IV pilus assembly protein [Gemmataceae bacterium]